MASAGYKKVLLKLSGESLSRSGEKGLVYDSCEQIALKIKELHILGIQIGIVIGGGNIFRGATFAKEMARVNADSIGMLATIINALALREALEKVGIGAKVLSSVACDGIVKQYRYDLAQKYLGQGLVVLFAGGTGNPYFSTDTAAALRACEMGADLLIKGTKVDGIYDKDPNIGSGALKYDSLTYSQLLEKRLKIMDAAAVVLCRDNCVPICVIDIFDKGALSKVVLGEKTGTLVTGE